MASLPTVTYDFASHAPVPSLAPLDDSFKAFVGAGGFLNGGSTGTKLLVKTSDATDPALILDQVGAGKLFLLRQNTVDKVTVSNAGLFTMANTGVNTGFNADQVDGIEGANIAQIGSAKIPFTLSFKIDDPSTFPLTDQSALNFFRIPAVQSGFITKVYIIYASGSHTSGGSVTFKVFINGSGVGSGVSLNNTNATIFTFYSEDFADQAITDGTSVTVVISARSGTITERAVTINVEGYQTIKA